MAFTVPAAAISLSNRNKYIEMNASSGFSVMYSTEAAVLVSQVAQYIACVRAVTGCRELGGKQPH